MHPRAVGRCWSLILTARTSFRPCPLPVPSSGSGRLTNLVNINITRTVNTSSAGLTFPKSPISAKAKEVRAEAEAPDLQEVNVVSKFLSEEAETSTKNDGWATSEPNSALLEINIQKCNSPFQLLQISSSPNLILKHACLLLLRLGQLSSKDKSLNYEVLQRDERFVKMCNLIQLGDYSHIPHLLFAAIQGLEKLGVPESSDIYQTLNVELKWAMRRCPIRYLGRAIALFSPSNTSKQREGAGRYTERKTDLAELAIQTLQRRWIDVVSGSDFISVFQVLHFLNEETRGKLEDRAVEMVSTFTPSEIRQIFIILATQKRRPTPLLRSLGFHFSKAPDVSTAKDLIDLTYALNELTFADPVLMEKNLSSLCPEVSSIENPASISSLVTSLGQMRYKHKALMQILDEWMMNHLEKLRPFDCATWLLTTAVLNHQSSNTKTFCANAMKVLSEKSTSSPIEWVNIVHSLLILNECPESFLASVLSPEFVQYIDSLGPKSSKTKIKLLNVNSVAKSLNAEKRYSGPLLSSQLESRWASSELITSDPKLAAVALETMNSFLSPEKYLTLNRQLKCGVFVDAICFLNKNLEPIPINDSKTRQGLHKTIAVVIEGYSSMTLGQKEPTGQTMLNRKLLQENGYSVISLPYTEFNASEKLIRRAKYFEQKLKALGNQPVDL